MGRKRGVHPQTPHYRAGYARGYLAGKKRTQRDLIANVEGLTRQVEFWRERYEHARMLLELPESVDAVDPIAGSTGNPTTRDKSSSCPPPPEAPR